jgi:hypothetical protein
MRVSSLFSGLHWQPSCGDRVVPSYWTVLNHPDVRDPDRSNASIKITVKARRARVTPKAS